MEKIQENRLNYTSNNFDLIRLFAALQVAIIHGYTHLGLQGDWIKILQLIPGVPIFFFVSGFLIYRSFQNSKSAYQYFFNRVVRIYPALFLCLIFSVFSVFISGYLSFDKLRDPDFWLWFAAQSTFFQFFNPDFMRDYGVGVLNGSLWTISVELQFYILTPLLVWIALQKKSYLFLLMIFFLFLNFFNQFIEESNLLSKLYFVSFIPWIGFFLVGAWLSSHENFIIKIRDTPFLVLVSLYFLVFIFCYYFNLNFSGNKINTVLFLFLALVLTKCAYVYSDFSDRFLKKNDISYGIYIYHMPVINFLIFFDFLNGYIFLILAMLATISFALLSWFFLEKPILALKKKSVRYDVPRTVLSEGKQ